jgi:hypothetical protein
LTPIIDRNADWYKVDSCIVIWIYMTCSLEVLHIVRKSKKETDAFSLWTAIHALYHDNQLQHAVFYEDEFHNLYQGDLSITDYCAKLKSLADNLRDVGQPISEPSQVMNLLHGLNPKYHHPSLPSPRATRHTRSSAPAHIYSRRSSSTRNAPRPSPIMPLLPSRALHLNIRPHRRCPLGTKMPPALAVRHWWWLWWIYRQQWWRWWKQEEQRGSRLWFRLWLHRRCIKRFYHRFHCSTLVAGVQSLDWLGAGLAHTVPGHWRWCSWASLRFSTSSGHVRWVWAH